MMLGEMTLRWNTEALQKKQRNTIQWDCISWAYHCKYDILLGIIPTKSHAVSTFSVSVIERPRNVVRCACKIPTVVIFHDGNGLCVKGQEILTPVQNPVWLLHSGTHKRIPWQVFVEKGYLLNLIEKWRDSYQYKVWHLEIVCCVSNSILISSLIKYVV